MKKKSRAELEKIVEAKTKGKQVRKPVATDDVKPEAAEVDSRISKKKGIIANF